MTGSISGIACIYLARSNAIESLNHRFIESSKKHPAFLMFQCFNRSMNQ